MYLALDTNAYRALADGNQDLASKVRRATAIGLPIVVLGELFFGIEHGSKKEQNSNILNRFLSTKRVQVLNIDETTARFFGEIAKELMRIGRPIQQNDISIAAICKQNSFILATRDKGFRSITGLDTFSF